MAKQFVIDNSIVMAFDADYPLKWVNFACRLTETLIIGAKRSFLVIFPLCPSLLTSFFHIVFYKPSAILIRDFLANHDSLLFLEIRFV